MYSFYWIYVVLSTVLILEISALPPYAFQSYHHNQWGRINEQTSMQHHHKEPSLQEPGSLNNQPAQNWGSTYNGENQQGLYDVPAKSKYSHQYPSPHTLLSRNNHRPPISPASYQPQVLPPQTQPVHQESTDNLPHKAGKVPILTLPDGRTIAPPIKGGKSKIKYIYLPTATNNDGSVTTNDEFKVSKKQILSLENIRSESPAQSEKDHNEDIPQNSEPSSRTRPIAEYGLLKHGAQNKFRRHPKNYPRYKNKRVRSHRTSSLIGTGYENIGTQGTSQNDDLSSSLIGNEYERHRPQGTSHNKDPASSLFGTEYERDGSQGTLFNNAPSSSSAGAVDGSQVIILNGASDSFPSSTVNQGVGDSQSYPPSYGNEELNSSSGNDAAQGDTFGSNRDSNGVDDNSKYIRRTYRYYDRVNPQQGIIEPAASTITESRNIYRDSNEDESSGTTDYDLNNTNQGGPISQRRYSFTVANSATDLSSDRDLNGTDTNSKFEDQNYENNGRVSTLQSNVDALARDSTVSVNDYSGYNTDNLYTRNHYLRRNRNQGQITNNERTNEGEDTDQTSNDATNPDKVSNNRKHFVNKHDGQDNRHHGSIYSYLHKRHRKQMKHSPNNSKTTTEPTTSFVQTTPSSKPPLTLHLQGGPNKFQHKLFNNTYPQSTDSDIYTTPTPLDQDGTLPYSYEYPHRLGDHGSHAHKVRRGPNKFQHKHNNTYPQSTDSDIDTTPTPLDQDGTFPYSYAYPHRLGDHGSHAHKVRRGPNKFQHKHNNTYPQSTDSGIDTTPTPLDQDGTFPYSYAYPHRLGDHGSHAHKVRRGPNKFQHKHNNTYPQSTDSGIDTTPTPLDQDEAFTNKVPLDESPDNFQPKHSNNTQPQSSDSNITPPLDGYGTTKHPHTPADNESDDFQSPLDNHDAWDTVYGSQKGNSRVDDIDFTKVDDFSEDKQVIEISSNNDDDNYSDYSSFEKHSVSKKQHRKSRKGPITSDNAPTKDTTEPYDDVEDAGTGGEEGESKPKNKQHGVSLLPSPRSSRKHKQAQKANYIPSAGPKESADGKGNSETDVKKGKNAPHYKKDSKNPQNADVSDTDTNNAGSAESAEENDESHSITIVKKKKIASHKKKVLTKTQYSDASSEEAYTDNVDSAEKSSSNAKSQTSTTSVTKATDTETTDTKTTDTKTTDTKTTGTKTSGTKITATKTSGTKTVGSKTTGNTNSYSEDQSSAAKSSTSSSNSEEPADYSNFTGPLGILFKILGSVEKLLSKCDD